MEVTMSLAFKSEPSVLQQEYATKSELHFGLRISYERIARATREGKLEVICIDGKLKHRVSEVVNLFFKRNNDLFA
jgi:hypothetical protein